MQRSKESWSKQLGLGVMLYHGYYAPKGKLQQYLHRDPIRRAIDERARQHMEQAAYQLAPISYSDTDSPFEIHFLSGQRFWYQTCFCAYSLAKLGNVPVRPIIYDDGSLAIPYQQAILNIFPQAQIVSTQAIAARLDHVLPATHFPYLRSRRLTYPNLRKLTDIFAGAEGWKVVLDSDMLFFRPPTFLLDWLRSPQQPCHLVDVQTSYGYSRNLMQTLAQAPIPEQVNAGMFGLHSQAIDWEELEFWCKTLIEQEGTNYYQEQAMVAMLMARQPCAVAPATAYMVLPDRTEVMYPQAVLHHYVADSKPWYFRYGWKHCLTDDSRSRQTNIQ